MMTRKLRCLRLKIIIVRWKYFDAWTDLRELLLAFYLRARSKHESKETPANESLRKFSRAKYFEIEFAMQNLFFSIPKKNIYFFYKQVER